MSPVRVAALVLLAGVALLAPFQFYPDFLSHILCLALFASAFNLLFGHAGILSFGHAAFFGVGAYGGGLLSLSLGGSPLAAIAVGTIAGGLFGAGFGALAVRRAGAYLAMITLALAEVVYFIALRAPFTGGENGLQGVPRGSAGGLLDLEDPLAMYYFALAVFLIGFFVLWRVKRSSFGLALTAIKENEPRAISLGYRVTRCKVLAFALSGALSGAAGALKALVFHFASLTDVHWHSSGEVILTTLVGGAGHLFGPVVGAALVVTLDDQLASIGEWVNFILGAIFVLCVLCFREGILGWLERRWQSLQRRGASPTPGAARQQETT